MKRNKKNQNNKKRLESYPSGQPIYLLILGCQRSGTSLLASLLGNHKDINMLLESITRDILKLYGKKIAANKLLYPRQIRTTLRGGRWGYFINRLVNLHIIGNNIQIHRVFPNSRMSLADYKKLNAKIIIIIRKKEPTISSMIKRTGYTKKQAVKEYDQAINYFNKLIDSDYPVHMVKFENLIRESEVELKKICGYLNIQYSKDILEGTRYNFVYPSDSIIKEKS